mgnify:CR=1 FL=1
MNRICQIEIDEIGVEPASKGAPLSWSAIDPSLVERLSDADLFHGVLNVAPTFGSVPSVITIHDLAFLSFPQTFRRVNRTYLTWATRVSARKAERILAVSEATKAAVDKAKEATKPAAPATPDAARWLASFCASSSCVAEATANARTPRISGASSPSLTATFAGSMPAGKSSTS